MSGERRSVESYSVAGGGSYQNEILALVIVTAALKTTNLSDPERLVAATSRNINLWGIFEFAASAPSNGLPLEIRQSIIRLAALVRYLSLKSVRTPSYLGDLIAINEAILDGLRRQTNNSPSTRIPPSGCKIDV